MNNFNQGAKVYEIQDVEGNLKGENWEMRKNHLIVHRGSFRTLVRFAVRDLGFDLHDFERAVQGMTYNGHNTLTFDSSKRLVSTSYQSTNKQKKTG